MGKQRVVLALDQDVAVLLAQLADGPHKKSDLIARLLRQTQADSSPTTPADPLIRIEERLTHVERKLDLLLAHLG